jgi:thiamine biosynthesis lipoprotein ApbE
MVGDGIVFESQAGKSVGKALTALEERIAQAALPVEMVKPKAATQRPKSRDRGGRAVGATARSTYKVSVPFSAAERRLILKTAKLDDEIAERLDGVDPQEEVGSLTTSELVRLAIATVGNPTKLSDQTDRKMWVGLSDRFHEVIGGILRLDRPVTKTAEHPDET